MLHRFATYEEAALFAARKRSEGYYAEVLHENASMFWGPMVVKGVSVLVSDEINDDEEMPDLKSGLFSLPKELSKVMGGATLGVIAAYFLWLAMQGALPALIALVVVGVILVLLFILLVGAITVVVLKWHSAVRDPQSRSHELAMAILAFMAALMVIVLLLLADHYSALGA